MTGLAFLIAEGKMGNATRKYSRGITRKMMTEYCKDKTNFKKEVMADLLKMTFPQKIAFCLALLTKRRIK